MADSKKIDDGGPAYPQNDLSGYGMGPSERDGDRYTVEGMSLRDWFAGQALPQFIMINERVTAGRDNVPYELALKITAEQAYAVADAMIAARKARS